MTNNISSDSTSNYDYNHILELHNKKNKTQAELTEYNQARANNPELDAELYEKDKAEVTSYVNQVQTILKKVAKGEKLSDEEQKIVDNDADLTQKVNDIKQKKQRIEQEVKNATPEQRKQILSNLLNQISSKDELSTDDMATVEIIKDLMYKYSSDDEKDELISKYKDLLTKSSQYEYNVD